MSNEYGKMTLPELRARLTELHGGKAPKGTARMKKGDLLSRLLADERADQLMQHAAEVEQELDPEEPEPAATVAANELAPEPKGYVKASKLELALQPYGWTRDSVAGDPDASERCTLMLRRAQEVLTVVWHNGVYSYEMSSHVVADRNTRLRNVSAAVKLGSRPAEAVEAEYAKVISNRRFRPANTKVTEEARAVPLDRRLFKDPSVVTEDELFAAMAGYRVVWVNRVSNTTESATVSQSSKYFKLGKNPAGEPVAQFNTEQGFRACRVADIISTSHKPGKARRTKTLPGGYEVRAA